MEHVTQDALRTHLCRLYPAAVAETTLARLLAMLERFRRQHPRPAHGEREPFDETDVWVIAYGDHLTEPGRPPLATLRDFMNRRLGGVLGGVHLLPHYPWTSDDGFAVVDYLDVDPALGHWGHVEQFAGEFRLMLDAVVNHTSASSPWFRGWLRDDPEFADFYITPGEDASLQQVVRPRTTPLLTPFDAREGVRKVWTTFGPDQVDLNYANPAVLLRVTEVLLGYVSRGASALRLDAVAFLWKRPGTSCIHLPETHEVVRLWRTVMDAVAPGTLLVTETNVPHTENLSYLGDGTDEAHLVYQFPLPPLVLHAFRRGNGTILRQWLDSLGTPSSSSTFLNFLSSHDGIGLRPVEGLLADEDIVALGEAIAAEGGVVAYRSVGEQLSRPYELNISYFDALNPPGASESRTLQVDRFVAAQTLLLGLAGVPAIYLHSLLGSRSWHAGVRATGRPRAINREKLALEAVEAELLDPTSLRAQVHDRIRARMAVRIAEPAFHPGGDQRVLRTAPEVLAFERAAVDASSSVLCVHNLTAHRQRFRPGPSEGLSVRGPLVEVGSGGSPTPLRSDAGIDLVLEPYDVRWLRTTT